MSFSESSARKKARVLCVGAATMDTIFRVPELPAKAGKVIPLEALEIAAGMASSAAVAISRLDGKPALWSCVGEDTVGERILAGLSAEGVDCGSVRRVTGARSAFAAILVDLHGERIVVPYYDPNLFSDAEWPPVAAVRGFDCVLADVRWPAGGAAALFAAREYGIPGVLDADVSPPATLEQLAPLASHAIFSEPAALSFAASRDIPDALDKLSRRLSSFVAITAGAEGCFWFDRQTRTVRQIAAPSVAVIDTLSAGDAFHGAFALALAEGRPIEETVRFANTVAASKCTRFGGRFGLPMRDEVEEYIRAAGQTPLRECSVS
jgi:sulfofructose kinase